MNNRLKCLLIAGAAIILISPLTQASAAEFGGMMLSGSVGLKRLTLKQSAIITPPSLSGTNFGIDFSVGHQIHEGLFHGLIFRIGGNVSYMVGADWRQDTGFLVLLPQGSDPPSSGGIFRDRANAAWSGEVYGEFGPRVFDSVAILAHVGYAYDRITASSIIDYRGAYPNIVRKETARSFSPTVGGKIMFDAPVRWLPLTWISATNTFRSGGGTEFKFGVAYHF